MSQCQDKESKTYRRQAELNVNNFNLRDGAIYRGDQLYVPLSKRMQIAYEAHGSGSAVHDGLKGTVGRLKSNWWPNLHETVRSLVANCDICQRRRVERPRPAGLLSENESFEPMDTVALDVIGPLPETLSRKKFIIVAVDHFTRFVAAKALSDKFRKILPPGLFEVRIS